MSRKYEEYNSDFKKEERRTNKEIAKIEEASKTVQEFEEYDGIAVETMLVSIKIQLYDKVIIYYLPPIKGTRNSYWHMTHFWKKLGVILTTYKNWMILQVGNPPWYLSAHEWLGVF